MIYGLAATLIAIIHLAFVVFVLAGALLLLRWPVLIWVHLPAAIWGVVIELAGWHCPLTRFENWLRLRAGREGYDGSFLAHYIFSIIYPAGLTRPVEIAIGIAVLLVNVGVYAKLFR